MLNQVKSASTKALIDKFVLPTAVIDFPRSKNIPAGYYFTEITDISARRTNSGKNCLDVVYHLEGFRGGEYDMRLSYPENSQPLQDFYAAMLKAGVPSGSRIDAAIGVTERIRLIYDDEDSIGRIDARVYDPIVEDDIEEKIDSEETEDGD